MTITDTNGIVLGAQGIIQKTQQDVTLNLPITLSASQTWKNTSTMLLFVSGGVNTGANALTVKDNVKISNSLNVQAGGTVNLPNAALWFSPTVTVSVPAASSISPMPVRSPSRP